MTIAISSAHGLHVRGARGFVDEVDETRKIVRRVVAILRSMGITTHEFHDDQSRTQAANLTAITNWHNRQTRTLDVSCHLNAFQTTQAPRGTEVLHRSQATIAARVSRAIADSAGFINRGAKVRSDLSFLNRTTQPSILLEVFFVDSRADVDLYHRHFEAICRAIAESILNRTITPTPPTPSLRPTVRQGDRGEPVRELQELLGGLATDGIFGPLTNTAVRNFQTANGLRVDGIVGPITWGALLAEDSNDSTT